MRVASRSCPPQSEFIFSLAVSRLDDKSRMNREVHVRFCESVAVRLRCATRPPLESFWGTLKTEYVFHRQYETRRQAMREISEYIELFYNRKRRQKQLGYLSPAAFERRYYEQVLAA